MMQFAFKKMDRSEAVENNAREAINETLEKLQVEATSVHVTFAAENRAHQIHISAHLKDGFQLELEQSEEDMYKAVELISDKMERQLVRHKEKVQDKHHK